MKKVILSTIIAVFILIGCKKNYVKDAAALKKKFKQVTVLQPEESRTASSISASGVLASEKEINFSFKIGGIVSQLNFDEGDVVRKGQLLAQLDLVEINAQFAQAKTGFEKADRDLKRVEKLYQDTVATLEQKQDAQTALELAKASLDIAAFNQRHARIIAPMTGKVLSKNAEEGELVSSGQPIYSIGSTGGKGSQILKIGISDRQIVKLKVLDTAQIQFDAFPNKKYPARITELSEEANAFTGTFDVELTLSEYFPELKNGFVGFVQLFPSKEERHYKIPMSALIEGDKKKANVFTTKDKKTVQKRQLEVQEIYSDFFTVDIQSLATNEWLVMEGAAYLNDQDTINIVNN
ncbi:MAG: efflux RND transporter periplasmic adaptor subunit [Bacteroidota bacterium]